MLNTPVLFASGDPVLYAMLAGLLLLVGGTIALGSTGVILLFGKSAEKKKIGKRLLVISSIPVVVAATWWVIVVGFD